MSNLAPDLPPQLAPFDPVTLEAILRATLDTLPVNPRASAEETAILHQAARLAVAALGPRDPWEAMLAARATAAHYAAMEAFRRAMQPDLPDAMAVRLRSNAVALSRLASSTVRELAQLQAARPSDPASAQPASTQPLAAASHTQPAPQARPAVPQASARAKDPMPSELAAPRIDPSKTPPNGSPVMPPMAPPGAPDSIFRVRLTAQEAQDARIIAEIMARAPAAPVA
jgi:hypothetical protein